MMIVCPTATGAVARATMPAGMPADIASVIATAALDGVAAAVASKRANDGGSLAKAIMNRGIAAYEGGRWEAWSGRARDDRTTLEGFSARSGDPRLDAALSFLLRPGTDDDHDLMPRATRLMLGHSIGAHAPAECQPCRLADRGEWAGLLRILDRPAQAVRNMTAAARACGWLVTALATEGVVPAPLPAVRDEDDDVYF